MAITRVQSKASASIADPGTATFDSTPIAGNLLVAIGMERSGGSMAIGTATISGTGWTQISGYDVLLADSSFRRAYCVWWKIAGASEPTAITIDNGTTNGKAVLIQEFNDDAGGTWDFEEKAENNNGTTNSDTSIGTGTTASTSGTQLILSYLPSRNSGTGSGIDGTVSFASAGSVVNTAHGANASHISCGFFTSTSTGTKTDTATCGANNTGLSSGIAVFTSTVASGIAIDAASNSGEQLAQSTYAWNHTCTGSERYLVVGIGMLSLAQTVSGITYGGVAMTFLGARSSVTGAARVELWGLIAPSTGLNSIAVTLTGAINSGGVAASYTGVNQSFPTEGFNSAQATNVGAADATVDITTVVVNDWVVDVVATDDTVITVGAGQTSRNNIAGTVGAVANSDEGPKTPAGSVTMSWTNVAALATWSTAGIALRPTTAVGSGTAGTVNNPVFGGF